MKSWLPFLILTSLIYGCGQQAAPDAQTFVKDPNAEALLAAAGNGSIKEVGELANAKTVNYTNASGWTALMLATRNRKHDVMKRLLGAGADPNLTRSTTLFTPLHLAAFNDDVTALELLLKAGADTSLKSRNDSLTALDVAEDMNKLKAQKTLRAGQSK